MATAQEIKQWFAANPNATDAQIYAAMQAAGGVTPEEIHQAMGGNLAGYQARFDAAAAAANPVEQVVAEVAPTNLLSDLTSVSQATGLLGIDPNTLQPSTTTGTELGSTGFLSNFGGDLGRVAGGGEGGLIGGILNPASILLSAVGKVIESLDKDNRTTVADVQRQADEWAKNQSSPERQPIEDPKYVLSGDTTVTYDIPGYGKVTGYPAEEGSRGVLTNVGIYIPSTGRVIGTPPMAPLPEPSTTAGGGGGGGGAAADGAGNDGGEIGSLEPDPDLMGGTLPETGTMPAPGPDGKPDPTQAPIPETTTKTTEEWVPIIQDWLIRFPNASDAEKQAAIEKYGVPAEAIEKAEEAVGGGGTSNGTDSGTGSSGSGASTGAPVTPTQPTPQTPPLPRPGPSPAPSAGPEVTPGTSVGPGTGTGTGNGNGTGSGGGNGGLFGLNATRTTEMVFPELYQPKLERFTVLGNLLSNQPWRYRA